MDNEPRWSEEGIQLLAEMLERLASRGAISLPSSAPAAARALATELETMGFVPTPNFGRATFALRAAKWPPTLATDDASRRQEAEMAVAIDIQVELMTPRQFADYFRHSESQITGRSIRSIDEASPMADRIRTEWQRLKNRAPVT